MISSIFFIMFLHIIFKAISKDLGCLKIRKFLGFRKSQSRNSRGLTWGPDFNSNLTIGISEISINPEIPIVKFELKSGPNILDTPIYY